MISQIYGPLGLPLIEAYTHCVFHIMVASPEPLLSVFFLVLLQGAKCDCVHGTCGAHCQRCCSGAAWAPHAACEERGCVCGERGACAYDDSGAILCVNCTVGASLYSNLNFTYIMTSVSTPTQRKTNITGLYPHPVLTNRNQPCFRASTAASAINFAIKPAGSEVPALTTTVSPSCVTTPSATGQGRCLVNCPLFSKERV